MHDASLDKVLNRLVRQAAAAGLVLDCQRFVERGDGTRARLFVLRSRWAAISTFDVVEVGRCIGQQARARRQQR